MLIMFGKMNIYKNIGLGTLIGTYLILVATVITAYLNPAKTILISINKYGEAHIDILLLIITFPFVIAYINEVNKNE